MRMIRTMEMINTGRKKEMESLWRLVGTGTVGSVIVVSVPEAKRSFVISVSMVVAVVRPPGGVRSSTSSGEGVDEGLGIGICILFCVM
jgi:hypothetical protein